MSALATLLKRIGSDQGIVIDDDELEALGLSVEEGETQHEDTSHVLSTDLPGTASGLVELFLGDDAPSTVQLAGTEKDGLLWYPIIRSGQWAVRPGLAGTKKRRPLKVVPGQSKDQRKEIGLEDLKSAFDDEAVQHVTVPTSHGNTLVENQGFVDSMKIVDGTYKDGRTKKDTPCKVLMGGYRFTEPEAKKKVERGTWANRSAGILYDYVNTETGKTYPAVIEHVALTNKPWITGMISFGRKLAGGVKPETATLSLSDEGPTDDELEAIVLASVPEEGDFLADTWARENSPNWLKRQVNQQLSAARAKKIQAKRAANGGAISYMGEDYPPYYCCVEAAGNNALISDGYSDDSNFWSAPISVDKGVLTLGDFKEWTPLKKDYVPDVERPAPPKDQLPLAEQPEHETDPQTPLQLAQEARRSRASTAGGTEHNDPPRGGGNMAGTNGAVLSGLDPEVQRLLREADERAKQAEERATKLGRQVERLTGTVLSDAVERDMAWIRSDEGGLGLSEERGFGGALVEIRELLLADDGEPAVQADHFSTETNREGTLSLSEALKRVLVSIGKCRNGQKSLGEMLSQPAEEEPASGGESGEGQGTGESGTNAGEQGSGKPPGKPGVGEGEGEGEGEQLSTEEKLERVYEAAPSIAKLTGRNAKTKSGGE